MTGEPTTLPASIHMCFPDRVRGIAARFEDDATFRELCRDFDEVVSTLASMDPTNTMARELKLLADELGRELISELELATDD